VPIKKLSKIEEELRRVTGISRSSGRNDQIYRRKLVLAMDRLDEPWDLLTEETKDWVNAGIDAMNSGLLVTNFPDLPGAVSDDRSKFGKAGKRGMEILIENGIRTSNKLVYKTLEQEGYKIKKGSLDLQLSVFRTAYRLLDKKGLLDFKAKI
jgi:hypothetical protein